jgi:deoxyribodipyrimidine photo-lyase
MHQVNPVTLFWFRRDLRLGDNPGFFEACERGSVLPIYILDDETPGHDAPGAASRWWLHESLVSLDQALDGTLNLYKGHPQAIIEDLLKKYDLTHVSWSRCYEAWRIPQDTALKAHVRTLGLHVESFNASLLWEPWEVLKKDQTPYKVFTPFYQRGCLQAAPPRMPLPRPPHIQSVKDSASLNLKDLGLLPSTTWHRHLAPHWHIGEAAAHAKLGHFLEGDVQGYQKGRDHPAFPQTSKLSPHLAFGEISPHQIWQAVQDILPHTPITSDLDTFLKEVGWREFSYHLLYHFPGLPRENFQSKFDNFPWIEDPESLRKWQKGQTGHPLVDAGMRQLWQTGTMHNRVRMVVASFLVKNLGIHWHHGARWFWDCLVDADLASNSASWQWVAGCGADAAPYFRVFNPATQGEKFDSEGIYTKHFVPELKDLPERYLFAPWSAPEAVLKGAGITLGHTYPKPMVDLQLSRQKALSAYQFLSQL